MVGTDLIILGRPNGWSFSKLDKSFFLENSELPSNKGIIVWVDVCSDKGSVVVNMNSKIFDALSSKRRKVFCPKDRVGKRDNILFRYSQLIHDLILGNCIFFFVLRKLRRISKGIKL